MIKLFDSNYSIQDIEEEMNEFEKNEKIEVVSVSVSVHPMHDLFGDGSIANRWQEYIGVIIYKSKEE